MADKGSVIKCPVCKARHLPKDEQIRTGVFAANCENCGHFFKYRDVPPYKTSVSFTVNGVAYTAGNEFSASTSLADFLREKRVSMGTKIMCKQGGCGICVVEAKMQLNPGQPKVAANLNSCLCPLFLCDGWDITTVEGLGSTRTGMHAIQSNLADFGGTQCGYCSPGHVMNMYGLTQKYPNMTKQFVEDHFEGNLCRCTGYLPILDAFKALVPATADDIEDISTKMCVNNPKKACNSNGHCGGTCQSLVTKPVRMVLDSIQWYKAVDYADLLRMLQQFAGKKIRLMGANTGTGAFYMTENVHNFEVVIDISGIPEFFVNTYDASTQTYTLGANVTLSDMIELFTTEAGKTTGNAGAFNELKKYLYRVASSPIRNRATWSGNLMLKNHTKTFPSDIFNIMTVLKASLYVGTSPQDALTPDAFFTTDMTGKALSKVTFSNIPTNDVIACFKVMPRAQNSLALVNGTLRCTVDPQHNYTVSGQPIISIGGISGTFHRATRTEAYLVGKQLSSEQTLTGAMGILATELNPNNDIKLPSPAYRKLVACALVYKYFLHVLGNSAGVRYRSGSTVLHDIRPLSSGTISYDTKKVDWPVNQPLKKLEADIQCTGEAEYVDDMPALPGQLYASFVKSTQANATIQNIDTSAIVGMPGVFKVLTAADIPAGGKNDINGPSIFGIPLAPEEALASSKISWYGQPVALVLADSQELADQAAFMVKVTYTNIQTPVVTIDDAIQKKSFFPLPQLPTIDVGDADQAISMSAYVTSGSFYVGNQYHFHMETQASNAVPTDQGLEIITTTQWTESVLNAVAMVCGLKKNKVTVKVKRLGGGYGGKITRNNIVAAVCGLAAHVTNRPVRMRMALWDNMDMVGKRINWKADYQVGHDANGKLNGVIVTYYSEIGYLVNEVNIPVIYEFMDNGYYCPNWKAKGIAVKTNKPIHTACRAPGSLPGVFFMEQMMEHVARKLNKDPIAVKTLNLYKQGQVTPTKMTLNHCNIEGCLNELMTSAQVSLRQKILDNFNRDNRWKKKALSVVPLKWGASVGFTKYTVLVNIHGADGSVLVHHGGVEMGQGINTKVAQVCAYELDIPVSMVTVKSTDTINEVNNMATGGSVTSETCCQGVIKCCTNIKTRMAPVKAKMSNPSWTDLVNRCLLEKVELTEKVVNQPTEKPPFLYNIYGATCAEVELDVLTGEYQINRVDIVHDCGESLNPAVDIGQIEGGFIQGMGYSTGEDIKYDPATGKILTNDTWTYHPPTNKDIPIDFRISLLKNTPNPVGVLRSKASGEPPLCMSCSVFFALRKCIEEARKEAGQTGYFTFNPPATVEKVQTACLVTPSQFKLQ